MKKGIDTSLWDPKMNWSQYDWDFAYLKASEGTVIDPLFKEYWQAARGHTARGAYSYFHPAVDPVAASNKLIEYLGSDKGELPPALDLEVTDGRTDSIPRALKWLRNYEDRTGVTPIVYSSPNFLFENKAHLFPDLQHYPLWLAEYRYDNFSVASRTAILHKILTGEISYALPPIRPPFKRMVFQQWTAKGNPADVPGYYTGTGSKLAVDFNFFCGTDAEFEALKVGTLPQPETGETMLYRFETTGLVRNIRAGIGANYSDIGDINTGDCIETDGILVGGWYKVLSIVRKSGGREAVSQPAYTLATGFVLVPETPATTDPDYFIAHWANGTEKKYVPE